MSQASDEHPLDLLLPKPEPMFAQPDVPTFAQSLLAPIRETVPKATKRLAIYIGDQRKINKINIVSRFVRPFSRNTEPICSDADWNERDQLLFDQLRLVTLDYQAVEQLSSLMPGIVDFHVVISHACITVLPQLTILLAQLAPTLQTLQLHVGKLFSIKNCSERRRLKRASRFVLTSNMRSLLQAINPKFVALRHLTLDIGKLIDDAQFANKFPFGGEIGVLLNPPTLTQLKEFYLHLGKCENGKAFFLEAIKKHATEKWTTIGLNGVHFENVKDLANSLSFISARKPELLTALPDVPTLAILSLLPLQQLFNLPLLHPRLAPFRKSVLMKQKPQRLVLHIGDQKNIKQLQFDSVLRLPFASHLVDSKGALLYPQTDTLFNTLHLATFDNDSIEQLSSLMPGIVHLKLVIPRPHHNFFSQLAILLSHWAPSLQTLQLNIGHLHSKGVTLGKATFSTVFSNFIQVINSKLGALQTLTLDISGMNRRNSDEFFKGGQTGIPLNLSILGQLREFYLELYDCHKAASSFLLDQLGKYATEKLTKIGLGGNFNWNWDQVANSQFATRFTLVPFTHSPPFHHRHLLRYFTNLTVYGFDWEELNARELVETHLRAFSTLSHLQCLKVDYFCPAQYPLPASFADLPPLSSVTVLEIEIDFADNVDHNHLQAPNWWALFPSVQILKVTHLRSSCSICFPISYFRLRRPEVTPCLLQLFAPLRDLPSLRKIFYQRKEQFDNIAEFTPQGEFVGTHEYIG